MLMGNIPVNLQQMITPVLETLGYQLWGIELMPTSQSNRLLRIYIDKPEGVNLDDCALVSQQLSALLDVENPISGEYVLEVSSPGMDRPIFTLEQFASLCGSTVRVKMRRAIAGRKNYSGQLIQVQEDCITLVLAEGEETVELPVADIDSARVIAVP